MNKAEFLEKLSEALRESMDDRSAYEHISYYSSYIEDEVRKGKSDREVIDRLGNPRLIAKSIVDRGGYTAKDSAYTTYDTRKTADNEEYSEKKSINLSINGKSVNSILGKIIGLLIIIAAVAFICLILWGISWLVLKVLLPVIIVIFFIGLVVTLIKSAKR